MVARRMGTDMLRRVSVSVPVGSGVVAAVGSPAMARGLPYLVRFLDYVKLKGAAVDDVDGVA